MGKKILVVDDSHSIRELVKITLTNAGYEVDEAADGLECLHKLQSNVYSLLLVDVNMPKVDGLEMVRQAKAINYLKFVPIIMLTTESQSSKRMEGKEAGVTGWMVKPFKPDRLVAMIKKFLP
ncbi:MAG: response regulator [Nitrospirae bacterium]|nr:response regulator [Nitrospirota bacterium]